VGDVKPVYLIYGDEFLREEAIGRLKKRLTEGADTSFDVDEFTAEEGSASEIIQAAETPPFLNQKHLVIVRGFDRLSSGERAKIAEYAKNPSDTTCLILVADKIKKGSPILRILREKGEVYEFKSLTKNELLSWIKQEFKKEGKEVSVEVASYLARAVGQDMRQLRMEIRKASLFLCEKKEIEPADLEVIVSKGVEGGIFNLVDAIGRRSRGRALRLLNELLSIGEPPLRIFYMVLRQFRLILKTKALMASGLNTGGMIKELGVPPFLVEKYVEQSKNFSQREIREIYRAMAKADLAIKRGERTPQLVLELLISEMLS
jgi:DNA polymerase-3 subunit delta